MSNDGLEALAALASVAPSSTGVRREISIQHSGGDQQPKQSSNGHGQPKDDCSSRSLGSLGASAPASLASGPLASSPVGRLHSSSPALSGGLIAQQLEQILSAVTGTQITSASSNTHASGLTPTNLALLQSIQQQLRQPDSSTTLLAMQQLAYYQYLAKAKNLSGLQVQSNFPSLVTNPGLLEAATAASLMLGVNQLSSGSAPHRHSDVSNTRQVIPPGNLTNAPAIKDGSVNIPSNNSGHSQMPPPSPPANDIMPAKATPAAANSVPATVRASTASSTLSHDTGSTKSCNKNPASFPGNNKSVSARVGRSPSFGVSNDNEPQVSSILSQSSLDDNSGGFEHSINGKKLQKRAANRRSAQLSRKRKKQFMEDLKEENDDLRRKEQILRSIPDLILVFDSTGKLWFVSKSVSRFLQYAADELEGTSIWERMCEDSVRLLKAAFMDSLAARQPDSDTALLGSGFWELRLVDRDGTHRFITLSGVVHFAGERPECVCSIRPGEDSHERITSGGKMKSNGTGKDADNDDDDDKKDGDQKYKSLIRVKPQQSVVFASSISAERHNLKCSSSGKGREAVRISDSGNSSGESETASGIGSSDELNGTSGSS